MLIRGSGKMHPEFDLAKARSVFARAGVDRSLRGASVTSPYDLDSVETLRDLHGLRFGRTIPTDVFVFGKGEPPCPDGTRVGGCPYWPASRPWPRTDDGRPYTFLAQFNFMDSKDIVPELVGDVLLLLVDDLERLWDDEDGERVRFEWLPAGIKHRSDLGAVPGPVYGGVAAADVGPFYGAVFRSADYPDAADRADTLNIEGNFLMAVFDGTKIGGMPHLPHLAWQHGYPDAVPWDGVVGERFLCQFSGIQAAPDVPYPWVNRRDALGSVPGDMGSIYDCSNVVLPGVVGGIYVFMDDGGRLKCTVESSP